MRALATLALTVSAVMAQSPLSTTFVNNNAGSVGGVVMFDLDCLLTTTIFQLDVNVSGAGGVAGTLEIRTCPTSFLGNETNPAAWTTVSTGNPLVSSPGGTPTTVLLTTPVVLPVGTVGVMLKADTWGHAYTNGTATGNGNVYTTNEMRLLAGSAANVEYTTPFNPRVANVNIHYTTGGGAVAVKRLSGEGCGPRPRMTFELFAHGATPDLVNNNQLWLYQPDSTTGGNYLIITGAGSAYDGATAAANGQNLATTPPTTSSSAGSIDDCNWVMTLPAQFGTGFPFPGAAPGGTTSVISINSNGCIWFGDVSGNNAFAANGANSGYTQSAFYANTGPGLAMIAGHRCDLDPSASGAVYYESQSPGGGVRITWDGVSNWQNGAYTPAAGPNFVQIELVPGGQIKMAWGNGLANGGSAGNDSIAGFTAGSGHGVAPQVDLTSLLGYQTGLENGFPLALDASARPITGTTFNMVTTNVSAASAIGVTILGFQLQNVPLAGIGAPDCFQYTDAVAVLLWTPAAGVGTRSFGLSGAAANGIQLYAQSGAFDPLTNALGVVTSNRLELLFNPN